MSIAAYRRSQPADPRAAEFRAFAHATARLAAAERDGATGPDLVAALHDNRELWTTLADDCAQGDNALTPNTRAGIMSLALWVQRHSSEVARGRAPAGDLVELNRTIMSALGGTADGTRP